MTQPALAIVRAWQEKSTEVSIRSKDQLFTAASKGFDAMAALLAKDSDPADVQRVLAYLNVDRAIALQFDNSKDDTLRDIVYGLLESLHVSLKEWNEERNQRKDTGEISTQTEEYTIPFLGPIIPSCEISLSMDNQTFNNISSLAIPSPTIPIEPKEELIDIHQSLPQDCQISASELMRDEEMIMKEEMDNQYSDPISPDSLDCISTTGDFTRSLLPFNPREEPIDQTVPQDNQMESLLFPPPSIIPPQEAVPIDFVHPSENMSTMGNFTPFNPKIKKPVETQAVHNDIEINNRDSLGDDRPFEDQGYVNVMPPLDFIDNSMNFDDEPSGDGDLILANPPNEVSMSTNDMDVDGQQPQDDSETANMEKRKRSSRHVPRPMQYAESMEDSDDNGGPSMKKSRSDSTRKDVNKRKSIKGEEKSGSVSKKPNVSKENSTELECPECEYSNCGIMDHSSQTTTFYRSRSGQRKETGEISTQTEDHIISFLGPIIPSYEASLPMDNHSSNNRSTLANPSPTIPIEPKEEPIDIHQSLPQDYQISASEIMRDEKMIMKEEMDNQYSDPISTDSMDGVSTAADFTRSLFPFNPREEPRNEAVSGNIQMPSLLFPPPSIIPPQEAVPIDFVDPSENLSTMGNVTPSNPKMKKEELMETQEVHNDNEIESMEEDQNDNEMQPSDFMDNPMTFDDEFSGDGDLPLAENNPPTMSIDDMDEDGQQFQIGKDGRDSQANDLIDNEGEDEEAMGEATDTPKDTSDSAKVEKRKRSSRHVSRPMQYAESMDNSDDDGGPSMKKSRSDSTRKGDNKRKSIKGEEKSGSVSKKPNVSKENSTELECPECEAGLALLCECGHESLSDFHSRKCDHGNTTVIRKRDGPIVRLDDEKATPQCVLCEVYPKTTCGYTHHLKTHHKSSLAQNGIYLMCSCGLEVRTHHNRTNLDECIPRQFTLHKLDNEKTTPQCVLCEAYPRTACGYVQHLSIYHKSTLLQNAIYLMCSCGLKVRSHNSRSAHLDGCNPRQFTLLMLNDE